MPQVHLNEQRRPFLRQLCDHSLYHFIKIIGGYTNQGGDISPSIHKPLCDFSQDDSIIRKVKYMPRAWLKTTCFTKWANIRRYLLNPEIRILIPSENETIGSRFLLFIENQMIRNQMLRWLYKDRLSQLDDIYTSKVRWSNSQCELPRKGIYSEATFTVIGVGGAAQSGHYDVISPDDIIGKAAMDSPVVMENVFRWFDNIEELLINPEKSIVDLVGTFWCLGDIGHYVQEKYPKYQWRIVPALKDEELKDTENMKYIQNPNVDNEESNFPEMFSTAYYHEMLENPEKRLIFFAQHQNNPRLSEEFNKFDIDWLKYFHYEDREDGRYIVCEDDKEEFKLYYQPIYGVIDPGGFGETRQMKKGSNNAFLLATQPHGTIKKFVLHEFAGKFKDPWQFADKVFDAQQDYRVRHWKIEVRGQQEYIEVDLRQKAKEEGIAFHISHPEADVSADAKKNRILSPIPAISNGEVYVHRGLKRLLSEMRNYPASLTVDLLDCLGWMNKLFWSRRARGAEEREEAFKYEGKSKITGY